MVAPRATLPDAIFLRSKHAATSPVPSAGNLSQLALAAYPQVAIEVNSRPRLSLQVDHGSISSCVGGVCPVGWNLTIAEKIVFLAMSDGTYISLKLGRVPA
jgi:hypothetical protein